MGQKIISILHLYWLTGATTQARIVYELNKYIKTRFVTYYTKLTGYLYCTDETNKDSQTQDALSHKNTMYLSENFKHIYQLKYRRNTLT